MSDPEHDATFPIQDHQVRVAGWIFHVMGVTVFLAGCSLLIVWLINDLGDVPWALVPVAIGGANAWLGQAARRTFIDVSDSGLIITQPCSALARPCSQPFSLQPLREPLGPSALESS